MIFNGHTVDSVDAIDEETFTQICVMYSDGVLGGKGVYDAISPLTTAVFNYMRPTGASAYKSTQIFPWVVEYEQNPDLDESKAQNGLIGFMSRAQGFNMERFNGSSR
jgi:hypothetical protein